MGAVARHLFHYRSWLDDTDQPYLVCAPDPPPTDRLPVVFLLHDTLPAPTASAFVESAYQQAAEWLNVLEAGPPALVVQPFGRGNAGWLGLGGTDLFAVWDRLQYQFACDTQRVSLLGVGAGATGVLQLATWFPDRFCAVAAHGAWSDDREDLPAGADHWPAWERAQRRAVSPLALADNLRGLALHIEHPWWFTGLAGEPAESHRNALLAELDRLGIEYRSIACPVSTVRRRCPAEPAELFGWLLAQRRTRPPAAFTTYSARAGSCGRLRIVQWSRRGRPARVALDRAGNELAIKTSGIAALRCRRDGPDPPMTLRLDRKTFALEADSEAPPAWLHFEKLGGRWQRGTEPIEPTPLLGGPAMDLRWDRVLFVPGTLGRDEENGTLRQFAELLRTRWQSGRDSINPHPADRSVAMEYPLLADAEVDEEALAGHHVIAIGHPWSNLLLARWRARLWCTWDEPIDEAGTSAVPFTLAGKRYDDRETVALSVAENPEFRGRYLFMVNPVTARALRHAVKIETAFMPDYVVLRDSKVLDWGYLDEGR